MDAKKGSDEVSEGVSGMSAYRGYLQKGDLDRTSGVSGAGNTPK